MRYSASNILRSSSVGGRLHFNHFFRGFGHLRISWKCWEDLISGWWDMTLLIFWGRLLIEIIFISSHLLFLTAFLNLSINLRKIWSVVSKIFPIKLILFITSNSCSLKNSITQYIATYLQYPNIHYCSFLICYYCNI